MKRIFILALAMIFIGSSYVAAQFPQMTERTRKKLEANEPTKEKENAGNPADAPGPESPPAKMNVDVQMVLTTREVKGFAEAGPLAVSRITDGDPLWLYIKFNGPLARYIYRMQNPDGGHSSVLFVEIGPQGDITAKNHYVLHFGKDDLALTELKISLSPGAAGHLKAMPIFLRNAARSRPGLWNNEIRLTNMPALPRGPVNHLAKLSVTYDFSKGLAKYSKMMPEYNSMVLRGTADLSRLPISTNFDSATLAKEIMAKINSDGIKPSRMYFTGDGWAEYSDQPMSLRESRNIFAAFTYSRGKDCLYGLAEVVQKYDPATNGYGNSVITLQKDIPVSCAAGK